MDSPKVLASLPVLWLAMLVSPVMAQPTNDNFIDAIELIGNAGSTNGTLMDSTVETGEPQYHAVGHNSVWYRWTATSFGQVTFDTVGPSIQTVVAAYTGTAPDQLTRVGGPAPLSSCARFTAFPGTTFYIRVAGNTNNLFLSDFVLNWRLGPTPLGVPEFAGEFHFAAPSFVVTEFETTSAGLRPADPSDTLRSALGAVVTVNRRGGSAGRVLVDYRTMNEVSTQLVATVITRVTEILPETNNMAFFTNTATVEIYYTNAYGLTTQFIATNRYTTNWVTTTNVCGDPAATSCEITTAGTNCLPNFIYRYGCPVRDYQPVQGTLYFDEFETTKRFVVPVRSDFVQNGDKEVRLELFNVRLADEEVLNPSGILLPTRDCPNSQASVNIREILHFNGGTNFSIERVSYAVDEDAGNVTVDILLPSGSGGTVGVEVMGSDREALPWFPSLGSDYATETQQLYNDPEYTDGTTNIVTSQDFTASATDISFPSGNPTGPRRITITIPIFDDNEVEFHEDIFIRLRDRPNQPPLGPNASAWITILDNDQPAGALDRDWNPDDVSYTTPRFNLTPGANNIVRSLAVQADQRTVIGGDFTAYNSFPRNGLARINLDGSLDPTFNPGTGADGFVAAVAVYHPGGGPHDGKVVVGGGFSSINNIQRNGIARLNANGSLDGSFNPGRGVNGVVRSVAIQIDGKVLLAGDFTEVDGVARNGIARLNANGTVDLSFEPGSGPDGIVWSVAVRDRQQTVFVPRAAQGTELEDVNEIETGSLQGVITVDYDFLNIEDNLRVYYDGVRIFNLTTNGFGQLTIPYGPGASTKVTIVLNEGTGLSGTLWRYVARIVVPPPERRIFIGGEFLAYDGHYRAGVARLMDDGSLDLGYDTGGGVDGPVYVVAPQADGRLLVGGWFSSVDFQPRYNLARLEYGGALDRSYDPGSGANDAVYAISFQADGKALVGGVFTSFNETRRLGLTRLFTDGSVDTSFLDTAYNHFAGLINPFHFQPPNYVNAVGVQTNGGVMIGGSFSSVGGNYALNVDRDVPWVFPNFYSPYAGTLTHVFGWQRADKRPRYNVARLIGGYTPGPGNVEFVYDENTTDENASILSVATHRVDGRLGSASAETLTFTNLATSTDFQPLIPTVFWTEDAILNEPIGVGDVGEDFVLIGIQDDTEIEGDELFGLGLHRPFGSINLNGEIIPLGTALRRSKSTVNIVDNDFKHGTFAFSAVNFMTNENAGTSVFTVVRTNGSSGQVTVKFLVQNGTATAGQDYIATNGTLTFGSGVTTQFVRVTILNDNLVEPDETFTVVLTNATGGATLPGGTASSVATTTGTIIDNDLLSGRANFASASYATNEGSGLAQVTLVRLGGSVGQLSVSVAAASGSATAGIDFAGLTNTVTWVHGDVAPKTILVSLFNDNAVEGNETAALRIFNPSTSGAVGSVSNATLNILDDDFYGALSFSQPIYDADERGSNVTITVIRTGGVGDTVSVDYRIVNGTAINGTDFVAANGTLTFAPGVTARSFQITIRDDFFENGERMASLVLSNFVRASAGALTTATLRIFDDETISEPAGSLDSSFSSQAGGTNAIHSLLLQPWDTNILVAGEFRTMNRVPRNRVARLRPDGSLDGAFNNGAGPDAAVRAMALQPDGRVLIGGFFTSVHGTNRNHIARLLADGTLDRFFNPGAGADNPVYALTLRPDGHIVAGGSFASFNGVSTPGVALLEPNGALSASFNVGQGANGTVFAVALQNDGKLLIGGDFTTVNGVARPRVARLHPDGSVDLSFNPGAGPNDTVRAITLQPDGRILIGGGFTAVDGVPRNSLARLESSGAVDALFLDGLAGGDDAVASIAVQFDGKIVVVGEFSRFNGVSRGRTTRLDGTGRTDPTINFGDGANDVINTAVIQPDRKILIGGRFTMFNGQPRSLLARLHGGSLAGPGSLEFIGPYIDAVENTGPALITVIRRGGLSGEVTVDYATEDLGSATPGEDYTHVSGRLTFREGETHQAFTVPILSDSVGEGDESLLLRLDNPSGGAALGNVPNALLTIINDDSGLGFSAETYTVNENVAGGAVVVSVFRVGATNGTTIVSFTTTNGTAMAGQDYSATNGVLTFAPGQTVQTFTVPIIDDGLIEGTETFGLMLFNATGSAPPDPALATVLIVDNDFSAGEVTFGAVSYGVPESTPQVTVTIVRTNGSTGVISVDYFTRNDTAQAGLDYGAVTGSVVFAEGQTNRTVTIAIFNDGQVEGNERFFITLTNITGSALLRSPTSIPVIIEDDDIAPGSVDQTFDPGDGPNALVRSIAVEPDGNLVIGGAFTSVSGVARAYVARLLEDGPLDLSFDPGTGPNAIVSAVDILPDTTALIGGSFSSVSGTPFNRVARLLNDGGPDMNFNQRPNFNGAVTMAASKPDGRVVLGGTFTLPTRGVTQLRLDGTVDTAFNPGESANGPVHALLVQPDGRLLIGGAFSSVDNVARARVARFHLDGFVDDSFVPTEITNGTVFALAQQSDGRVIVGGDFNTSAGTNRVRLLRLNTDGSIDNTFQTGAGPNDVVYDLVVQSDDKIIVAGAFTSINGAPRGRFARLNASGAHDPTFETGAGANNVVYSIALLPSDDLIIAGDFTQVGGLNRTRVARILAADTPVVTFLGIVVASGTNPRMTITSIPGRSYILERSSDFQNWSPITTNAATGATVELVDPELPGAGQRFYRARER